MIRPGAWTLKNFIDTEKPRKIKGFSKKSFKKVAKKFDFPLAFSPYMLYNMAVVCLWDDAAGCRPALAGNCSGPALLDRATGSTSHRWTIAARGRRQRDSEA